MTIINYKVNDLIPYENNPRHNDGAVKAVANSIKEFGFKVPIVIDKNNVIIAGHTRLKAAKELGLEEVPCIVADDLTEDQIKAFRLADNKVGELSEWDFAKLEEELAGINMDMTAFEFGGFNDSGVDWAGVDDLNEETYEKPEKTALKCPHCGFVDTAIHFKKVEETEEEAE